MSGAKKGAAARRDAPPERNPTIYDVAKRAGVSIGTVSRVLNRVRNVKPELSRLVLKAAQDLDYRPNHVAQSMRSKQTRAIGVVMPDVQNPLVAAIVSGIEKELAKQDYTMFLAHTAYDREREERIFKEFQRRHVDGIIAMVARDDDANTARLLKGLDRPLVLVEREMALPMDSVRTNQVDGAYRATRYLLGLGHARIGLISVPLGNLSGRLRLAGFKKAHADVGREVPADFVKTGGYDTAYALDAAYDLLSREERPTAVVVSGGLLAGVIMASRQLNLAIPQDLSVVSLGDTEIAALMQPAISAVRYDWEETGRIAANLIFARVTGTTREPPRRIVTSYEFLLRHSCAAPSGTP